MDSVAPFQARKAKGRGKSWSMEETRDLVLLRQSMDEVFKKSIHITQIPLWEQISDKMNSKYESIKSHRSPTACKSKWKHVRHEYRRMKEEGRSIEGYFKVVQNILEDYQLEPAPSMDRFPVPNPQPAYEPDMIQVYETDNQLPGQINEMDYPLGDQKALVGFGSTFACSQQNESGTLPGIGTQCFQPVNGNSMQRSITVHNGIVCKSVFIDESATTQSIEEAIRVVFQLGSLDFYLEDQDEVVRPVDKNMPTNKVYKLHVVQNLCNSHV
ncbi:hypothetical protein SUGI_0250970 [Cryptomeria japonica]|uniref:trihelix transcription factor GT-1-like n=1 Tax=Cryptomeria japonica TaxID=3369 RepID=UPI002408AE9C|nr:trihelix transcription factor GT-1-like [Cryptomeria japonica]GLJ15307.1 hypothetical protein SUGI_0250970 [Cryptomeria japonica]